MIETGSIGFRELSELMLQKGDSAKNESGRQELIENIINRYFDRA